MMNKKKALLTVFTSVCCAVAIGTAFSSLGGERADASASADGLISVSPEDFDSKSFVFSSSTTAAGGLQYGFTGASALPLDGQTGIAVRVKNLYNDIYQINQIRVIVKDSLLVYSPYNSKTYFYWENGYVSQTSDTARYVKIPAYFDGYMLLPFTEMTVLRHSASGSGWVWTEREHLSADKADDFALPSGSVEKLAMYTLANTNGRELMIGAHSTYVLDNGKYVLGTPVYADYANAIKPGSEPLPVINPVTTLTCHYTVDENAVLLQPSVTVPYGYRAVAPVSFASGYEQDTVTVTDEGASVPQTSLAVGNVYHADKTLSVAVTSKRMQLDGTARVLDPDDNGTSRNNFGGRLAFANNLSSAGYSGIFIRVRNTLDRPYEINTLYLRGVHEELYSLMNTEITYVSLDGTATKHRPAALGKDINNRTAIVPALFDGYMLVPFDELVSVRIAGMGTLTDKDWEARESSWLQSGASDPKRALPTCELNGIEIYFSKGTKAGENELIIGSVGTYTGEGADFRAAQTTALDQTTESLTGNGGLVAVTAYPQTQLSVTFRINEESAFSDGSIDLGISEEQVLSYGQFLQIDPKISIGYALSRVELTGAVSVKLADARFVNLCKEGGEAVMNFVTEETAQVTVSGGDISLADKVGVKVRVNAPGSDLSWRFSITDGEKVYTASAGAGLIQTDHTEYGNVFSLPAGFNGTLYIPFNIYRGSSYGGKQITPFDYATAADKPASVTGKIYPECLSGQTKEELLQIFGEWEYVTALPEITKARAENVGLYREGDGDLVGGTSVSPNVSIPADKAGSASNPVSYAYKITPSGQVPFGVAGLAFRVKNVSGENFGWRIYVNASNGKIYVPQAVNSFTLISGGGTVTQSSHNNRNVIIPAGFDGTVLVHFSDFATDNVAAGTTENVVRRGLDISYIRIYCAGGTEGVLLGEAGTVDYDGTYAPFGDGTVIGELTASQNAFTFTEISSVPVTVNNADVVLSASEVIFGTSEIRLSPADGKLIVSASVPEGCTAIKNADGTMTVTVVRSVKATENSYELAVITDDALAVSVETNGFGAILYGDADASAGFIVPASVPYRVTVTADAGYRAVVTAGDAELTEENGGYAVPAGTSALTVTFVKLQSTLRVTVSGNGAVQFDGAELVSGFLTLDQGEAKRLSVSPGRGYDCTVTMNGEPLAEGESGYEVAIYEDAELTVAFTVHEYRIDYDLDRGTNGENPSVYTVNDAVTFADASKEGYRFLGWFVLRDGVETEIKAIERNSVGDVHVFAKFEMIAEEIPDDTDNGLPAWGWALIGTGIAVLCGGAIFTAFAFRKKKGMKK